jgi:hypothetical protein
VALSPRGLDISRGLCSHFITSFFDYGFFFMSNCTLVICINISKEYTASIFMAHKSRSWVLIFRKKCIVSKCMIQ